MKCKKYLGLEGIFILTLNSFLKLSTFCDFRTSFFFSWNYKDFRRKLCKMQEDSKQPCQSTIPPVQWLRESFSLIVKAEGFKWTVTNPLTRSCAYPMFETYVPVLELPLTHCMTSGKPFSFSGLSFPFWKSRLY